MAILLELVKQITQYLLFCRFDFGNLLDIQQQGGRDTTLGSVDVNEELGLFGSREA